MQIPIHLVIINSVISTYFGLVPVSTGVMKFGKPSAESMHRIPTWKLNINAKNDNFALAAA